jgi:hypothetical protein
MSVLAYGRTGSALDADPLGGVQEQAKAIQRCAKGRGYEELVVASYKIPERYS